jgi:hypothetical protein
MEPGSGPTARHSSRQRRRVLIVADAQCIERGRCAGRWQCGAGAAVEALVVAPAHETNRWVIDEGAILAEATHRLQTCSECLAESGVAPAKRVGDADAVQAIADALAVFPADEVLMVSPPLQRSWGRKSVVDRARAAFRMPIEHIVVSAGRARGVRVGGRATI